MILVDTSIWVEHLRSGLPPLAERLEAARVLMHPFVLGELACGNLKDRAQVLDLLSGLPKSEVATDAEVLAFIEHRRLMGRGIGYIDAHLLVATCLSDSARLWTLDRRLAAVAESLAIHFAPGP